MDDMPHGAHEQVTAPRDHLWVAVIIAACALLEVWASWLGIGSVSGFPELGHVTTGWILPVTTEAYWAYALWTWLAGAPGPRSRKFAMWTAGIVFALSLLGQESGHLLAASHEAVPPAYVVAFVTALPLISLALVAVLVHLRQADREELAASARAAERAERLAATERAEADERTRLRAELDALKDSREADMSALRDELTGELEARDRTLADAETALTSARSDAEKATARVAVLERKLGGPARRSRTAPARTGTAPQSDASTAPDDDLELEAKALKLLATNLDMSGAELARHLGVSEGYGRKLRRRLTGDRPSETEADRPEDRTGTARADRGEDRA